MSKVLLINGSPHPNGCTRTALDVVAETLGQESIDTELIHIGHKDIRGCIGCYKCAELRRCVFDDDMVNEVARQFAAADGIVIGTPVYFGAVSGTLTSFLNRLFFSIPAEVKRFKVGAAIVSARRAGTSAAFDQLNKYFLHGEMPIASSRYWNIVHGTTPDEVMQDEEGMQTMRVLGRNMAFLIQAVALQREAKGLPERESKRISTNFIR